MKWRSERAVVVLIGAMAFMGLSFLLAPLRAACMGWYLSDEGIDSGVVAL